MNLQLGRRSRRVCLQSYLLLRYSLPHSAVPVRHPIGVTTSPPYQPPPHQGFSQRKPISTAASGMLDINLFREDKGNNPEIIRESQRHRFADVNLVDEVIRLDKEWRQKQFELDNLQKDLNEINKEIARLKISGGDASEMIKSTGENKRLTEEKSAEVKEALGALNAKLQIIGNLVHDSVPISNDEANNQVVRTWGEKRTEPKLKNHVELVELLGIADTVKGAKVAGSRGFYLEEDGLDLNQALINFGLRFMKNKGYKRKRPPFWMRKEIMAKCAQLAQFNDELYKVTGDGDDKYLIATAEQPLCAYHMDDWIHPSELPIRYAGYSSCFRKEAGTHGRDTLGIYRDHQFDKVEQFCITSPNGSESWDMLEEMMSNSEEFYQMLKLPYRVVAIVSGALNDAAAKKYELEAWFPASSTYRELVSCSNCTDYQSRRLEIRSGQKKSNEQVKQYVHLLNCTLTATERTICCILENYQKEDGVEIPEVLQPFMGGLTFLPFQKKPAKEGQGKKTRESISGMLDINLFREDKGNNPEIIRESQRRRFADVNLVDEVIRLDKEWRQKQFEVDNLQKDFNKINKEIVRLKISGGDASEMIKSTEENKRLTEEKGAEVKEALGALNAKLQVIGNLVHDSVPISNDEANNQVVRTWGEKRTEPKLKNHVELVELLGIADTNKGAKVAGGRGFYLKEGGVFLNQALIIFGLLFLKNKGYEALQTPFLMRKEIMAACAQLAQFDEELYKVTGEGDDKYLIATAEQPLCAYHMGDWIPPSELPIRYAGYSLCFCKEAGSHGRDTLGIFGADQSHKVEQFCITSSNGNESWDMLEEMMSNSEEFYQMLKLPYQVVAIVSGALNDAAAKKYDLEAWFPASSTYRELVSCSNCTDYQSRGLEICYGQKKSNEQVKQYVHLLNCTLTATERTICCILENYQKEDGVDIPEILQPFMGGLTFLPFQKKPAKEGQGKKSKAWRQLV